MSTHFRHRGGIAWIGIASVALVAGCSAESPGPTTESAARPADASADAATPRAVLHVRGMSCPLCAHSIEVQLRRVPGVADVRIDLGSGEVTALLKPFAKPTEEQFAAAIRDSGFTLDRVVHPSDPNVFEAICSSCKCTDICKCKPGHHTCTSACSCSS